MTHGAAGRVGTRGVNGNAPSAGAAPHCRVEPRVPQPLTPWGRVPRAARPSGTKPGSVPVSPGRGNAAPRLCRRLGLRSSPRTPPAPPKHPSPSRLCRRSPGRCHPAVFRTALSQPVPNCLSALRCGRRSARHGGLCGHTAVRRAASGLAGSTAGSAVGAPQREGLGRVGGCGRAEAQLQNRTSRSSAEPRVTAGAAWPLPSGAAAGAVHRSDSELPADVRARSCTYMCTAHTCACRPLPPPPEKGSALSATHRRSPRSGTRSPTWSSTELRAGLRALRLRGAVCRPCTQRARTTSTCGLQAGNGCPHCSTPARPCPHRTPLSSRAPRVSQRTLLHPAPPRAAPRSRCRPTPPRRTPPRSRPAPPPAEGARGQRLCLRQRPARPRGVRDRSSARPCWAQGSVRIRGVPAGPCRRARPRPSASRSPSASLPALPRSVCHPARGHRCHRRRGLPGQRRAGSTAGGAGLRGYPEGSLPCSG